MRREFVALIAGGLFGAGLALSQMINPVRVLGFLDVAAIPAGGWDPTLAFVMAGALAVTLPAFRFVLRQPKPLFEPAFHLPEKTALDVKLLGGSVVFGVGWGLVGLCPGPALAGLALIGQPEYGPKILVFVLAMLAGAALHAAMMRPRTPEPAAA